jgi:hypothetical protein
VVVRKPATRPAHGRRVILDESEPQEPEF